MKEVNIGLIGYGMSGSVFHAPLISSVKGLILHTIVSKNPEKVHQSFPKVKVVPDVKTLLADSDIDVVVVTSPNPTHFSYAKQALAAHKHVIVEKPFVNHVHEADELIALAAKNSCLLSVFQNRRWDNDYLTVEKCIREGLLGELFIYEAHYDLFRPQVSSKWKEHDGEGSGALYDLGSHLIDQALNLFGMPHTVSAEIIKQRVNAEVDDYFHVVLGYGKLRVILQSGWVVKQSGPHFQVHGSNGSILKYGLDPQQGDLQQGLRPGNPNWGEDKPEMYATLALGNQLNIQARVETVPGCYECYYQGIYDAVVTDAPLPVTAVDARNTIQVIEYARQSNNEQRVIVVPTK